MTKRAVLALLILSLLLSCGTGAAAVEHPDFDRKGSISITMTHKGEPVSGGKLTLYRVGAPTVDDDWNYSFVYTETFASCEVPIDDPSTEKVAKALADLINRRSIPGTGKTISKQGTVRFDDLEVGLYLLVQYIPAYGYNIVSPFLVSVPQYQEEDGQYIYEVDASPKVELEPRETTKPTESTTPKGDKIPQTGQVNWPVPVLTAGGLLLLLLGHFLRSSDRKKRHET